MDDFEKRDKEQREFYQANLGLLISFIINLGILGYNALDMGDNYYEGERLALQMLRLEDKISFINGRTFETDKLSFTATDYKPNFLITHGAFKVAESNKQLLNRLLSIDKGDTIVVRIYKDHLQHLDNEKWNIPIIELAHKSTILINRNKTKQADSETTRWDLIVGTVIGIVLMIWLRADNINKRKWW